MKKTITGVNEILAGMALRWYRELRFLSLAEVAEEVGISKPYLSSLESGKRALNRKLEKRIIEAINSMSEKTRIRATEFAIQRINSEVFQDSLTVKYRWKGVLVDDNTFRFTTEGIKVEFLTAQTEEEELFVQRTKRPLLSGNIRVTVADGGWSRYFVLYPDKLESSLEDFGEVAGPKVAALFEQLKHVLGTFIEVRPKTVGEQLRQILKAK